MIGGALERNCSLNEFGYVPQSSALDSTFPITAREVVAMGGFGRLKPYQGLPGREKQHLQDVLEQVGLDHLAGRSFFSLSGGQRQRMLIARALMVGPKDIDTRRTACPGSTRSRKKRSANFCSSSIVTKGKRFFFEP